MVLVGGKKCLQITVMLSMYFSLVAGLSLSTIDESGKQISTVIAGEPFYVAIKMENTFDISQVKWSKDPEISLRHYEEQMYINNGHVTKRYVYVAMVHTPGSYTLGPLLIDSQNKKITSNTVIIDVVEARDQKRVPADAFLTVSIDKTVAFVGQLIRVAISFYQIHQDFRLRNVDLPTIPECTTVQQLGPVKGSEKINGVDYDYTRWEWDLLPQQVGHLVIPECHAYYADMHNTTMLDHFFNPYGNLKRTSSSLHSIEVRELPACTGTVLGIGEFHGIKVNISPPQTQQGDPMILTIDVITDGQSSVHGPKIENLAPSLRCYDSKSNREQCEQNTSLFKHTFEYIIQGIEPGLWQIPSQEYFFFDVSSHTYKKVVTDPVSITIAKNQSIQLPAGLHVDEQGTSLVKEDSTELVGALDELYPVDESINWYMAPIQSKKIPWWLFLVMCIAVVLHGMGKSIWFFLYPYYGFWRAKMDKKNAAKNTRKAIKNAEKIKKDDLLYDLFIAYFSHKFGEPLANLSTDFLQKRLDKLFVTETTYSRWSYFFGQLQERKFSSRNSLVSMQLFKEALSWIDILEQLL